MSVMATKRVESLTLALMVASVAMATADAQGGPVVTTKYGKIRGFYTDEAAIFYGVPFASPPVGNLRSDLVASHGGFFLAFEDRRGGGERGEEDRRFNSRLRFLKKILLWKTARVHHFLPFRLASVHSGSAICDVY